MKKTKVPRSALGVVLAFAIAGAIATTAIMGLAEINYQRALQLARESEGTDAAIESAMRERGYDIDALAPEPSIWEKVRAFNIYVYEAHGAGGRKEVTNEIN